MTPGRDRSETEEGHALRPNFRVLVVYLLGVFVGALDMGILGPAFPLIAQSFHISLAWMAWTVTIYSVTYVAATVLAGAAGDRHGRRRIFLFGIVAFAVASTIAALSHVFWVFLLARAVQGLGAGAVYPNAQAEGTRLFPPGRRGMALGIFGAVFGVASIVGPNLGGALAQFFGWPWIFLINIPIAAAVLVLGLGLPESERSRREAPDFLAGIVFALFLALALVSLDDAGDLRIATLLGALLLLAVFVARERRPGGTPFLDPHAMRGVSGAALVAGAAVIGVDMSAALFVPTLAQENLGLGVLGSGFALMPAALSAAVLAPVAGIMSDRLGGRGVLQTGLAFAALGGVLLALPGLTLVRFIVAMLAFGVGTTFTMGAPLNRLAIGLYHEEQTGEALANVAVFRSVGIAAGPVLLTLAMAWHRFTGMFAAVALISLIGVAIFLLVPDVRGASRQASEAS